MDNKITQDQRETQDFMNVESFSQLPFIRPAPPPPVVKDQKNGTAAIRLFGKEFGVNNTTTTTNTTTNITIDDDGNNNSAKLEGTTDQENNNTTTTETISGSSRKFECHYCCRNFPTSQALGGHQNAHKRERQHAKRAHLQSAMVHGGGFSDAHVYGLMNYNTHHRFGSSSSSSVPIPMGTSTYNSWNNNNNNNNNSNAAYYYNSHVQQQPINGSPLALWRIPTTTVHTSSAQQRSGEQMHQQQQIPLLSSSMINSSSSLISSQTTRVGYDSKARSMQDHVSLDLHL